MSSIHSLVPRDRYAALERCTYLNQASLGLIPLPAIDAMETFLQETGQFGNLYLSDDQEAAILDGGCSPVKRRLCARPILCATHLESSRLAAFIMTMLFVRGSRDLSSTCPKQSVVIGSQRPEGGGNLRRGTHLRCRSSGTPAI